MDLPRHHEPRNRACCHQVYVCRHGLRMGRGGLAACIVALGMVAAGASAQPPATQSQLDQQEISPESKAPTGEPTGPLSIELELDVPTAYFFRGYNIVDGGYIIQPSAYVYWNAVERDELSVRPYLGIWANYIEQQGPHQPKHFNELDLYAGSEFTVGRWTFELGYLYYNSPSDSFDDIHEAMVSVGYDHWLAPKLAYYREIDDRNGSEDAYLQAGIAPGFAWPDSPVTFEFPLAVGLSPDGYYLNADGVNSFFGYASVGLVVHFAISDHWEIIGRIDYYHLNADSLQVANDNQHDAVVGQLGTSFSL